MIADIPVPSLILASIAILAVIGAGIAGTVRIFSNDVGRIIHRLRKQNTSSSYIEKASYKLKHIKVGRRTIAERILLHRNTTPTAIVNAAYYTDKSIPRSKHHMKTLSGVYLGALKKINSDGRGFSEDMIKDIKIKIISNMYPTVESVEYIMSNESTDRDRMELARNENIEGDAQSVFIASSGDELIELFFTSAERWCVFTVETVIAGLSHPKSKVSKIAYRYIEKKELWGTLYEHATGEELNSELPKTWQEKLTLSAIKSAP